jgi:flagellar motility protein MotE (MotC chaperone)
MKKYVLPVLMWMIILKAGVVAVYLAGNRAEVPVVPRDIPEETTVLSVPVHTDPLALPALPLMSSANAADTAGAVETGDAKEPVTADSATQEQMAVPLAAEKQTLLEREKYLERQEAHLKELKEEITRKIDALTLLREEILAIMDQKNEIQEAEVKHLIKIYSTMKPQKVAQLIEQLDIDLVTALFSRMKGDVVGDILSFVDSETGARITRGLFPEQTAENSLP